MDAVVIGTCAGLVLAGAWIVARDGRSVPVERSWPSYLARLLAAGLAGGVLAAGAGGRLVMRLLALTSPASKGALTEAQARIGEITAGGTLGFFIFVGVPRACSARACSRWRARPRLAVIGAGAVVLAALVALPGFVLAVGDIVTSG